MGLINVKDRIAQGDNKYIIQELEDGRKSLIPSPDEVVEPGTPLNSETLQPLFNAQYYSTFVLEIADDNTVSVLYGKTLLELYFAISNAFNVAIYCTRPTGSFTTMVPLAGLGDGLTFVLCETSLARPMNTRFWSLRFNKISFMSEQILSPAMEAGTVVGNTNSNGNIKLSDGDATFRIVSAYAKQTTGVVPLICQAYLDPSSGDWWAHVTNADGSSLSGVIPVEITYYYFAI